MAKQLTPPKVAPGNVLTVANRHYDFCGKPPDLTAAKDYTSYFENDYGEQLVFQYNRETEMGILWHGDIGWQPLHVKNGYPSGWRLSDEEREWLALVWRVATRHLKR